MNVKDNKDIINNKASSRDISGAICTRKDPNAIITGNGEWWTDHF